MKIKKRTLSKAETFEAIYENLEQSHPNGIPEELIIIKMTESTIFSKVQARDYFKGLYNSGMLYEPKLGFFNMVS